MLIHSWSACCFSQDATGLGSCMNRGVRQTRVSAGCAQPPRTFEIPQSYCHRWQVSPFILPRCGAWWCMNVLVGCHIGVRSIHELIERYGVETFRLCTADLIDYAERLIRADIRTWPKGQYSLTDYMVSDSYDGSRVKLHVTLTLAGDSLTADFTGTSPQMGGAMSMAAWQRKRRRLNQSGIITAEVSHQRSFLGGLLLVFWISSMYLVNEAISICPKASPSGWRKTCPMAFLWCRGVPPLSLQK
jgi:Hydantoinase B/oxoprolinase